LQFFGYPGSESDIYIRFLFCDYQCFDDRIEKGNHTDPISHGQSYMIVEMDSTTIVIHGKEGRTVVPLSKFTEEKVIIHNA